MNSSQTLQRGLMILRILTRHGAKGMRIHEIEKKSNNLEQNANQEAEVKKLITVAEKASETAQSQLKELQD